MHCIGVIGACAYLKYYSISSGNVTCRISLCLRLLQVKLHELHLLPCLFDHSELGIKVAELKVLSPHGFADYPGHSTGVKARSDTSSCFTSSYVRLRRTEWLRNCQQQPACASALRQACFNLPAADAQHACTGAPSEPGRENELSCTPPDCPKQLSHIGAGAEECTVGLQQSLEITQVRGYGHMFIATCVQILKGVCTLLRCTDLPESIRQDMERYAQKAKQTATSISNAPQREVLSNLFSHCISIRCHAPW